MKRTLTAALLAVAALLANPAAAAEPLLRNGDFASPAVPAGQYQRITSAGGLPGWSVDRGDIDLYSAELAHLDGAQAANLNGSRNGSIHQSVALEPGQTYELTWYDAPDTWPGAPQSPGAHDPEKESCLDKNATDQEYEVGVNQARPVTHRPTGTGHRPEWQAQSHVFTAEEGDTSIRFDSQADPQTLPHCGPQISRVTLTPLP
ncbi:DUF642 domain-containing protein [Streptomyces sp. G5(2025)]|uniref:DUF642 domain-containing protein n=1 Tax=Streptomyces sp. G5(2025) TaxID=3406628 RepID=UPI003C26727C